MVVTGFLIGFLAFVIDLPRESAANGPPLEDSVVALPAPHTEEEPIQV
jgi:hypothetical protein